MPLDSCEVASYNPANDMWTLHPHLKKRNNNLSGATLKDKIFTMGGGNGTEYFAQVEMHDPQVGRWIPSRSMWQKVNYIPCLYFDSDILKGTKSI